MSAASAGAAAVAAAEQRRQHDNARERNGKLSDVDPYRAYVGASPNPVALAIAGIALGVAVGMLLAVVLVANLH
jgi:hypothetical protein